MGGAAVGPYQSFSPDTLPATGYHTEAFCSEMGKKYGFGRESGSPHSLKRLNCLQFWLRWV
jgi:hypothetical protein